MTKDEIIKNAVNQLMDMFESGKLPEKIAFSIIHRHPDDVIPSDSWSIGNRILQMLAGTSDARGYKQWQSVGRQVKKGSNAVHILAPLTCKVKEKDKMSGGEVEKVIVKGYRPIPVFCYEDTEGEPLPCWEYTPSTNRPTFFDAAEKLGISVRYAPMRSNYLGRYSIHANSIELCSEDAIVYYHELAHAVHATFVDLRVYDQDKAEMVAEFSALVLANIAGIHGFEVQGFNYIDHYAKDHSQNGILKEIFGILNDVEKIVATVLSVSEDKMELAV